jgi:hypothetical protein
MLTAEEQLVLEQLSDYEYSAVRWASPQFQAARCLSERRMKIRPDLTTPE